MQRTCAPQKERGTCSFRDELLKNCCPMGNTILSSMEVFLLEAILLVQRRFMEGIDWDENQLAQLHGRLRFRVNGGRRMSRCVRRTPCPLCVVPLAQSRTIMPAYESSFVLSKV